MRGRKGREMLWIRTKVRMVFKNKQINKANHHCPGITLHRKFRGRRKQTLKTFQGTFVKVRKGKPK